MKILMFIDSLGAGGAERSMLELAKFLKNEKETEVLIACLKKQEFSFEGEAIKFGIPLYFNQEGSGYRSKVKFLKEIVERESPDIIHSVLAEANFIVRFFILFYRKRNIKVIQSLVNTPYSLERKKDSNLPWQKFQLVKQLDKWTARVTPNIFYHAITHRVLEHYKPIYNIKNNYEIIYRGRERNPCVRRNSPQDHFMLINVGRQEFAKGQIDILKALKYIKDNNQDIKIHLQILGRPGEYSGRLNNYIEENDLKDQVELKGFVNDVEKRLVEADAFVFPSYYEGLGGALLEAFAAGLPCICSNIPVLKEVVGDERGALFCDPGDYKKLAKLIIKLHSDEELRNKLSDFSEKRFEKKFEMKTINFQMLNMYSSIQKNNS